MYIHTHIYENINFVGFFFNVTVKKLTKRHFLKYSYILIFTNLLRTDNETETEKNFIQLD